MSRSREVIFVDPSVVGWESIVERAGEALRVVLLDSAQDGLAQIAAVLAGETGLAAIHLVSHGSAGQISLGNATIDAASLARHDTALAQIGASLADGGDILLYGCDIGQGAAGGVFMQQLARATGADIAASTDLTGAVALGGDWELEARVGAVAAGTLEAKEYAGTLAIINGTENGDWLAGTAGADIIFGKGGDDSLIGGAGNDTLDGGADGTHGDTVSYADGPSGVTVNLQAGTATDGWGTTDTLVGIEHVTGSDYDDTLIGSAGRNWFRPGQGNDAVYGNGGDDVLMYEGGLAAMTVDLRTGTASGADIGTDTLSGIRNLHTGVGADTIQLSDLSGYVFARAGDDTISGGAGNDHIIAGSGNDRIDGGAGRDFVDYIDDYGDGVGNDPTGLGVTVNLAIGIATDNWGYTDTLSGIESIGGSRGNDTITGDAADNNLNGHEGDDTMTGGDGRDWLYGGAGNDSLQGGDGDDSFTGGLGADTIDGGAGNDSVHYGNDYDPAVPLSGLGVTVNLATGLVVDNWGHTDKLAGIENARGSSLDDNLTGDGANNSLGGEAGDDTLSGGDGDDSLWGGAGTDRLDGGAGIDHVDYWGDFGSPAPTGLGVTVNLASGSAIDNWGNAEILTGIENVRGSRHGDTITGTAGDNSLHGQEGNDTVNGGDGRDWVSGGSGDDKLQGGLGDDHMSGGAGTDTLDGGDGRDTLTYANDYDDSVAVTGLGVTVNLATGIAVDNWGDSDTLAGFEDVTGSRHADTLTGDAAGNNLWGQDGNDTIDSGDGVDWLDGGAGDDKLLAGLGNDSMTGGTGADTLDGGDGRDRVDYRVEYGALPVTGLGVTVNLAIGLATDNWGNTDKLAGIEDVTGSRFGDVITGSAGDNSLQGQEGNDTIVADDGSDNLNGGSGNDNLQGGLGDDYITGGAGVDAINGGDGHDSVDYQNEYDDMAMVTGLGVKVNLTDGTAVDNWGDADTLVGIENATGSRYADIITGSAADNNLWGLGGSDRIIAGAGADWVDGGDSSDNLDGGLGDDRLVGGAGADLINGGEGRDSAYYWHASGTPPVSGVGATVNLATGVAVDSWGNTDKLVSIEDVNGSAFNDTITGSTADNNLFGSDGDDSIRGGAGNDYLDGGSGADTLLGEAGSDRFSAGAGNDKIDGGDGIDEITYWSAPSSGTAGVTVNLATGSARDNWGNTDALAGIENVSGSSQDDILTGNALDNTLRGDAGDDTIAGGDGRDNLTGGAGNDKLQGGAGDDSLYGDVGNDTLTAGDGNDYLDGGSGDDTLIGGSGANRFNGGTGADTIDGGAGIDSISYFSDYSNDATPTGLGVNVNLTTGVSIDNWGHADKLAGIEQVTGSRYADTITGSAGDDTLSGHDGDDTIVGGAGVDYLRGGNGNDKLQGGAGYDRFYSDAGNDTIDGGAITDLARNSDGNTMYYSSGQAVVVNLVTGKALDGHGGVDTLLNINSLVGSMHDDVLTGSSRAVLEIFYGEDGDDVINGGAIIDRFSDNNGNRVGYQSAASAVEVDLALGMASGGGGNDILANITQVWGSYYDDVLLGSNTDLIEGFYGDYGNDFVDGRGGLDQVIYTRDWGSVNVNLGTGIAIDGSGGTDILVGIEGARGSNFDDVLIGGNTDNGDAPGEGLEFFSGEAGNDTIDGSVGFDRADYTSSSAAVTVVLGGLAAGSAADGFGGTDVLLNIEAVRGSDFNDILTGSDSGAFESFEGRRGSDTINGMGGIDLVDYSHAGAAVNVNLTTGVATDGQGGTDKLTNIEQVRGSLTGNDVLYGNTQANTLEGLGGNDSLNGGGGADTLIGGDGNDTYYVDHVSDVVLETSARTAGGIDQVVSAISYKLGANVENLRLLNGDINATGNSLNNVIFVGAGRNAIDGGAGTDTLSFEYSIATATSGTSGVSVALGTAGALTTASGISGGDTVLNIENLSGSKFSDSLTGNSGANTINGGSGNDYLNGGNGNDVLTGGAGADWFVFNTTLSNTGNVDTITDFSAEDTIRLENAVFTKLATTGALGAANFKVIGSSALDANDYILYDKASGYLYYDADGSGAGAAIKIALVGVNLELTSGDFTVT